MFNEAVLFDEPMYDLNENNIKKIASALEIPSASFFGHEKYKTLEEKTSALFYLVIKNHAFPNGNKRTAIILSLLFLMKNGYWLKLSQDALYRLAIDVASIKDRHHDKNIKKIEKIIKPFIIQID